MAPEPNAAPVVEDEFGLEPDDDGVEVDEDDPAWQMDGGED